MSNQYESRYIVFPEKGVVEVNTEIISSEDLGPDEVIIKAEASVMSAGTELANLNGLEYGMTFPVRPGYGMIGRIVEKGENITDFNVGDRVFCAGKHGSYLRFKANEHHQWNYLFPVPEDMEAIDATIGCMAEIAMTAPNRVEINLNDTVAVFGLGMVGLLAAKMMQLRGAKVIALDPSERRCERARALGLDYVLSCPPAEQLDKIMEITNGAGAKITVDAVGHSAVVMTAIKAVADFGHILTLGSPRADFQGNLTDAFSMIHMKCCTLHGAHMHQYPVNAQRGVDKDVEWCFATCFDLIKSGKIDVKQLISHVISVEDAKATYDGLAHDTENYFCAVIDWSK